MKTLAFIVMLLLAPMLALANGSHESELEEGRKLVESRISCDVLSNAQLEAIGEYLMEQMHPGDAHEAMHRSMGMEEGTAEHQEMHANMARMMYCDSNGMMRMMSMMGGMTGGGRMAMQDMMGGGMMGWTGGWGLGSVLGTILLVGLIVLVWLAVIKLWRDLFGRKR